MLISCNSVHCNSDVKQGINEDVTQLLQFSSHCHCRCSSPYPFPIGKAERCNQSIAVYCLHHSASDGSSPHTRSKGSLGHTCHHASPTQMLCSCTGCTAFSLSSPAIGGMGTSGSPLITDRTVNWPYHTSLTGTGQDTVNTLCILYRMQFEQTEFDTA